MDNSFSRDFKGIWISKDLWFDNRLSHEEKILMAEIDSLDCGSPRHCYASNEYLCKFMACKIRHLGDMLAHLRSLGFIESVSFNGRERNIKSNLKTIYAKFSQSDLHEHESNKNNLKLHMQNLACLPGTAVQPCSQGDFIERDNKDDNKERKNLPLTPNHGGNPPISPTGGSIEDAPKSGSSKRVKEQKKQRLERVWLTDKQEENLKLKLDNDELLLKLCYQKLSDWKISKGITGGNDYLSILKWVIKAVNEDLQEKSTITDTSSVPYCSGLNDIQKANWIKNYKLVQELKEKLPHKAGSLNFFYKNHILKDKNRGEYGTIFDVNALIDPRLFRLLLEKHLGIEINERNSDGL